MSRFTPGQRIRSVCGCRGTVGWLGTFIHYQDIFIIEACAIKLDEEGAPTLTLERCIEPIDDDPNEKAGKSFDALLDDVRNKETA